jgi:hypothetical protein
MGNRAYQFHLKMGTERFPETLCFLSDLTRLTAREEFITNNNYIGSTLISAKCYTNITSMLTRQGEGACCKNYEGLAV